MEDLHKEIEELRAANRILAKENAQLSERAEDGVMLAQIFSAMESVKEPDEIIDRMLERFSILKDLPFVTCGQLQNLQLERIAVYTSLSDDPEFGYPLELRESDVALLATGPLLIGSVSEMRNGFPPEYQPSEVLLLPFDSRHHGKCIVLVCGRPGEQSRLSSMAFLLYQAVRMVATRLDNVFLSWQLAVFNGQLEERVFEKTRDLHKAHHRLLTILHGIDNYGSSGKRVPSAVKVVENRHDMNQVEWSPNRQPSPQGKSCHVYVAIIPRFRPPRRKISSNPVRWQSYRHQGGSWC